MRHHKNKCKSCSKKGNSISVKYYCCHSEQKIKLNISKLTDNLNFQLIKYPKRKILIETIAPKIEIKSNIHRIGVDYLDIKQKNGEIVTVWKDKIKKIYLLINMTKLFIDDEGEVDELEVPIK